METIILRCDDQCCMLIVDKINKEEYSISIQDSRYESNSTIFQRIKNAFKILFGKKIYYNDLYIKEAAIKTFAESLNNLTKENK